VKRFLDVCVSLVTLVILAPLLAVVAIAIKLDSRGPVFFLQERVGRGMRRFRVVKFRTMTVPPANGEGLLLTVADDPRITSVGRFLRKTKLDEFPQLLNVLLGDMSLVGPRPEVPKYVELFAEDFEIVLGVRPGLTDPASFKYRNEAALLGAAADAEREYVQKILPDKIRLAKAYVADSSLLLDLTLILKTLLEAVGMEAMPVRRAILKRRRVIVVAIHQVLVVAAYYLAWNLRFDGRIPPTEMSIFWRFLPWLLAIRAATFAVFRLYQGLWRYTSMSDAMHIVSAVTVSALPFVLIVRFVYGEAQHPRSVFVIDAVLLIALMASVRLVRRAYYELGSGPLGVRILVFGAADTGEMIVRELKKSDQYRVVGLLDDDSQKHGRRIHGVEVLGGRNELPRVVAEKKPSELLIALTRPDPALMRDLVRLLAPFSVKLSIVSLRTQAAGERSARPETRDVQLEDLLARPVVYVDQQPVNRLLSSRHIMVTGAGGSIGSELCRQIVAHRPASLVLVDRYENGLHATRLDLEGARGATRLVAAVADVTDAQRMEALFQQHRPSIVFHSAAHKHVPLMEENPCEAVKNNVSGTRIVAELAHKHGVERFVLISTDKAVNPTSVMGASKRAAELVIRASAQQGSTSFSTVRFGNVLGSNGSVIPRFMDQIRAGGPVTVTHPDVRRFFMLIPEAVQLVIQAAAAAQNGATYALDMGEQIKLVDMARNLIRLSGLSPDEDIAIEFVGLRPGEKLSEELVGLGERSQPSGIGNILSIHVDEALDPSLMLRIADLERDAAGGAASEVLSGLYDLVGRAQETSATADVAAPLLAAKDVWVVDRPQVCPDCQHGVHRSRARGMREGFIRGLTHQRLYRCEKCGWRGWLTPLEYPAPPLAEALDPVNLAQVDEALTETVEPHLLWTPPKPS